MTGNVCNRDGSESSLEPGDNTNGPARAEVDGEAVQQLGTVAEHSTEGGAVLHFRQQSGDNERHGCLCDGANACHAQGASSVNSKITKASKEKSER